MVLDTELSMAGKRMCGGLKLWNGQIWFVFWIRSNGVGLDWSLMADG